MEPPLVRAVEADLRGTPCVSRARAWREVLAALEEDPASRGASAFAVARLTAGVFEAHMRVGPAFRYPEPHGADGWRPAEIARYFYPWSREVATVLRHA